MLDQMIGTLLTFVHILYVQGFVTTQNILPIPTLLATFLSCLSSFDKLIRVIIDL